MENKQLIAKTGIHINTLASKVWEALTNPEMIKLYFFGVDVVTDWKKGSSIKYKGEWDGKPFEDKGTILEIIPGKKLVSDYWSSFSGLPDEPEYYQVVSYILSPENDGTRLDIEQTNISNDTMKEHSEKNWDMVLQGLKNLLENK